MMGFRICYNCSESRFASCSGGGGCCYKKRQFFVNFEHSGKMFKRLVRPCDPDAYAFCTVHGGTAADGDQCFAIVFDIEIFGRFHVFSSGIRNRIFVNGILYAVSFKRILEVFGKP